MRTASLLLAGLPLALLGTACSSDDESTERPEGATPAVEGATDAGEPDAGSDAASDLDVIGGILTSVLRNATGHEVDGDTLRITFSSGSAQNEGPAHCETATSSAEGAPVVLSYPDGDLDCSTVEDAS